MPRLRKPVAVMSECTSPVLDQDVSDAYLYLLGRLLVLRQEHLDFARDDFRWNEFVHRDPGGVGWANPNLDVASSEAWVAVDEKSATLLHVPEIGAGRYHTIQILNLWGETIANINEREYPDHPAGTFALCLKDAPLRLPEGTTRIDLPGRKARVLMRIELGADPGEAVSLQHQVAMQTTRTPTIPPSVPTPMFSNEALLGVDAFDTAVPVLASEPDSHPRASVLQAKVRAVAAAVESSAAERRRVDHVIREQAWGALRQDMTAMGLFGNGWVRPKTAGNYGRNWRMRTVANLTGLWANYPTEIVQFGLGHVAPLNGSGTYAMRFAPENLPGSHVAYFWSVTCVDAVNFRVVPNLRHRFLMNTQSPLQRETDGSLILHFAPVKPAGVPDANWLPTPMGERYILTWRSYGPDHATLSGAWFPPPLRRQ
jgi:hypothetical protein